MNNKNSTLHASIWAFSNSIGTRGLSFLFFILLSRALSPLEMGVMALALSVSYIADTFADAGLSESVIRADSLSVNFLKAVTTVQVGIATILTVAAYFLAPYLSVYFKQDITWVLPAALISTVINACGLCPQAILKKELRFKEITIRNLLGTIFGGLAGIYMAHAGFGVWSLVAMNIVNAFTATIICCYAAHWIPLFTINFKPLKECTKFAIGMTTTRVIENSLSRADQFVIGAIFGAHTLGLYSLAVKLYDVLFQIICGPFSDVFLSKLAGKAKHKILFVESFLNFLSISSLVGPAIFSLCAMFFSIFLPYIFGEQWQGAYPFILIILIFGSIQSIAYIHSVALVALGMASSRVKLAFTSLILWGSTVLFLMKFGAIMAAVAWACRVTIVVPLQIAMLKSKIEFSYKQYLTSVAPGFICMTATLLPYAVYKFLGFHWGFVNLAILFFGSMALQISMLLIISVKFRALAFYCKNKFWIK